MKLCETPPVVCSACFLQKTDQPHVDFDASWDGPSFPDGVATEDGVQDHIPVTIDELILCSDCLRSAHSLLAEGDDPGLVPRLQGEKQELSERLAGALAYISALESERGARDTIAKLISPPKPKPRQKQAA